MSLVSILKQYGTIKVGTGEDATPIYPFVAIEESSTPAGVGGTNGVTSRKTTYTLTCIAEAASIGEIGQLNETLASQFNRVGDAVAIVEMGGAARTIDAGGTGDVLPGYPIVKYTRLDRGPSGERSVGTIQIFRVTVECIESVGNADPISHEYTKRTSVDELGRVALTQRGTVRTQNGTDARAWAQNNVITQAAEAAANGDQFLFGFTEKQDATIVEYDFSRRAAAAIPFQLDIIAGEITTRELYQQEGGRVTSISGFAVGNESTQFANGQRPNIAANQVLTREEISQPRTPDGRVDYRYEILTGGSVAQLAGINVVSYRRSVTLAQPGGRGINAATFAESDPILYRGELRPWIYAELTDLVYIGSIIDVSGVATLGPEMSGDNLDDPEIISHTFVRPGVRRVSIVRRYVFATEQTIPGPEIVALPGGGA